MRGISLLAATLLAVGAALVASAGPAKAAFPGANGKIAYQIVGRSDYEIQTVNPDRTGRANLTNNESISDREPAWSADGSKVAFVSAPYGESGEIYTMDADGSDRRQLTETPNTEEESPAWSPDGTRIVFWVRDYTVDSSSPEYDLYVVNADGTGVTRLTTNPGSDYDPAWSPDGTKIVFGSNRDGSHGVYTMAPAPEGDSNRPRRLAGGPGTGFDWSPDGSKIVFTVGLAIPGSHDAQLEVFVMNADGTGRTRLTFGRGEDRGPAWSPNGKKIAFTRNRDLCVMNAAPESDANRPRCIDDPTRQTEEPDWQPIP